MSTDKTVANLFGDENVLSPSDVCAKEFGKSLLGYRCDEVDQFLERIANVLDAVILEVRDLRAKNTELKARVDDFRNVEETLRGALESSQRFAQDIVDSAKREAAAMIEEARARKGQIELEAAKLPAQLSHDIRVLEQQRDRLRAELLTILETHRGLLDSTLTETRNSVPLSFFDVGTGDSPTWEDADTGMTETSEGYAGITTDGEEEEQE